MISLSRPSLIKPDLGMLYSLGGLWRAHPRYQGILGHWMLGEAGGLVAFDYSGRGQHGTMVGVDPATAWISSVRGKSLDFDAVDARVNLDTYVNNIGGRNTGSISVRFKTPSSSTISLFNLTKSTLAEINFCIIYLNNVTGAVTDESISFVLSRAGGNQLVMHVINGNGFYGDDQWHHAVVSTGAGDNFIVVDGVRQALTFQFGSVSTVEFSNINGQDAMRIGNRIYNSTDALFMDGIIDDVRVYDHALSVQEAISLYEQPNLEFEWAFDLLMRAHMGKTPSAPTGPPVGSLALVGAGV
jgi:hypothetical protein